MAGAETDDRTQIHGKPRDDIIFGALTDVGREREDNQDALGFYEPADDQLFSVQGRLAIVCDGMGGHRGGRTASGVAIATVLDAYERLTSADTAAVLREAVETANRTVFEKARAEPDLHGMGTTCVAVAIKNGLCTVAHVGDSRCYLLRDGRLHRATRDHSLVQELVDRGLIAPEQAEHHPEKNVILRSLGVKPEVEVDVRHLPLKTDDVLLLCSDGLSGLINDEEIRKTVEVHRPDLDKTAHVLVEKACDAGGHDNVTASLVSIRRIPEVVGGAAARFHIVSGSRVGEVVSLFPNGPRVIGSRRSADVAITDEGVSWSHARISFEQGTFYIEDAGSDTGTFVNGEKLASRQALAAGDLIRLGPTIELVFGNHG